MADPDVTEPPHARRIRLLLVDRHELSRRGLAIILRQEPDVVVVGEAAESASATRLASELAPDVVVVDERTTRGSAVVLALSTAAPYARMVVLTGDDMQARPGPTGGTVRWLPRDAPADDLVATVRAAAAGRTSAAQPDRAVGTAGWRE